MTWWYFFEDLAARVALVALVAHRVLGNPVPYFGHDSIFHVFRESLYDFCRDVTSTKVADIATLVAEDLIAIAVVAYIWSLWNSIEWRELSFRVIYNYIGSKVYSVIKVVPFVKGILAAENVKLQDDMEKKLSRGKYDTSDRYLELPTTGKSHDWILSLMKKYQAEEDKPWKGGKVSGGVYHGGEKHCELLSEVYKIYSIANPLHGELWPSLLKFEAECLSMAATFMNGRRPGVEAVGTMTSGGTESIIMSVKTHRQWAKVERGVTAPEMIVPDTAHAAFDKAAEMLCIKIRKAYSDKKTHKVNPRTIESMINRNTIMIVGSAPQFPHGVIDPIEELSRIAVKYGVGLHVDCCLGGFVLPFARELGYELPKFDFLLPGVTAMSMDTHKFGYASKGSSIVLYRSSDIRQHQYFLYPEWPGGLYGTPSTPGSRNGSVIAQAWASMMAMGMEGYKKEVKGIMETAIKIREGIKKIPGLKVMGEPQAMVVAFGSDKFDVYRLCEKLGKAGWHLNILAHPPCAHICVTKLHVGHEASLLKDLKVLAEQTMSEKSTGKQGNAPVYGLAAAAPAGPLRDVLTTYIDTTLKA